MIDILIPTFNRADFLKKNILLLNEAILARNLHGEYRIVVSNNNSSDNTVQVLDCLKDVVTTSLVIFHQPTNIGLEPNALFLLGASQAEYVMYVGDDDFVPAEYLSFVVDKIKNEAIQCIIPGFSGLSSDGTVTPARNANFHSRKYNPGFYTVCRISQYGHQLSGLVVQRQGLFDSYMSRPEYRNLYPFIYFVSRSLLNGSSYYAPHFQVLVSQGNSKDWRYDDSGLLIDIFKNYNHVFNEIPIKAAMASLVFAFQQPWRLTVGKKLHGTFTAFKHLISQKDVSLLVKIGLILPYSYALVRKIISVVRQQLRTGTKA